MTTALALTRPQKAAAILVAMGKPAASRLLKFFKQDELKALIEGARLLRTIPQADLERIVLMVGPERMCSTITSKDRIDIRTRLRDGIRPPGIGKRGRPLKDPNTYGTKRINDYSDLIPRIIHHAEVMRETTFNLRRERRHPGDSDREKEGVRHRKLKFEEQRRLEKVMDRDLADMVLCDRAGLLARQ